MKGLSWWLLKWVISMVLSIVLIIFGSSRWRKSDLLMLLSLMWEILEKLVVNILVMCMLVLVVVGVVLVLSRKVVVVML